jgi:photosystem II stability/assembly factor-like uncharacterized protein
MKHLLLAVSFIVPFFAHAQDGWKYIGPEEAEVRNLVIDGDLILCSMVSGRPMYRSTNAGYTWGTVDTALFPTGAYRIEIMRGDPSVIIASLHPKQDDFYTSRDGGLTWDTTGTLPYASYHRFYVTTTKNSTIFETVQGPWRRDVLFRSTDLGQTWEYTQDFPFSTDGAQMRIGVSSSGRDIYMNVDTDISGAFFYRSTDGGITWAYQAQGFRWPTQVVVDAEDPLTVYCTSANHIHISNDGGSTWSKLYTDDNNTILTLLQDPNRADNMYLFTEAYKHPSGVYGSTDRGKSWTLDSSSSSLPFKPYQNSTDPFTWLQYDPIGNRLYLETKKGIYSRSGPVTDADPLSSHIFLSTELYPQPVRETLRIKVDYGISGIAVIGVYNVLGAIVYESEFDSRIVKHWNLRDQKGLRIPNGIYIVKISAFDKVVVRNILVIN